MKDIIQTILKVVGVIAILFIILAIIVGGEDKDEKTSPTPLPSPTERTSDQLGDTYREGFLEGCTEEGGTIDYCLCVYDYLDSEFTNERFLQVIIKFDASGDLPVEFYEGVEYCTPKEI